MSLGMPATALARTRSAIGTTAPPVGIAINALGFLVQPPINALAVAIQPGINAVALAIPLYLDPVAASLQSFLHEIRVGRVQRVAAPQQPGHNRYSRCFSVPVHNASPAKIPDTVYQNLSSS
jgi:hypothetical protein